MELPKASVDSMENEMLQPSKSSRCSTLCEPHPSCPGGSLGRWGSGIALSFLVWIPLPGEVWDPIPPGVSRGQQDIPHKLLVWVVSPLGDQGCVSSWDFPGAQGRQRDS